MLGWLSPTARQPTFCSGYRAAAWRWANPERYLGTYLAPDAIVELGENATLQGALYGQKLNINKGATVTGEPALGPFISLFLP